MAGAQITVSQTQLESQRFGYHSISLTNLGSTAEPQIAAGSKVEIGGALFNFAALESITGWAGIAVSKDVWIKLVVSGTSVTAEFTITAPTWSTSKQGWYSGGDRYVAWLRKSSTSTYLYKHILPVEQLKEILFEDSMDIGDWNMNVSIGGSSSVLLYHEIEAEGNPPSMFLQVIATIRDDSDTVYYHLPYAYLPGSTGIAASLHTIEDDHFTLRVDTGSIFDSADFDATSYNRGTVRFRHKVL